jgi:hypothetical protein
MLPGRALIGSHAGFEQHSFSRFRRLWADQSRVDGNLGTAQRVLNHGALSAEITMGGYPRIKARLFVAAAAAMLTLSLPVDAQIPSTSGAAPSQSAETVNLTMEQRHIIKEIIVKEMKIDPPQEQGAKVPMTVGAVVPSGIPLKPMPVEVAAKVPQVKSHSFVVKDDKVLIIDPKDNRVAALIQ